MAFTARSEEQAPQTAAEAALLRQTVGLVASLPEVDPPAGLRHRVLEGLAEAGRLDPMGCRQVGEALDGYLEGELSRDDERSLHLHLAGCGTCRRQVEQARAAVRLTGGLAEVAPSPVVRERVVAEMASRTRRARVRPAVRRIFATLVPLAAAAALVFAVRTQGPRPGATLAVAPERAVTTQQPAQPETAPEVVATRPVAEPEAAVAVAAAAPATPRRESAVRRLFTRVAGSVVPRGVAEAAAPSAAEEAAGRDATAVSAGGSAEPGPADRMAAIAERESVIQSEDMLAKLPQEPAATEATAASSAESAAGKPEATKPRLDLGLAPTAAPKPTPVEPGRMRLQVHLPTVELPEVIRIERNRSRPVDLPLIRREY